MNLGKFQGKSYCCKKPGHRVQDLRVKLNAGWGAVQGREKLHAAFRNLDIEVSSSTVAQRLTVLEDKLGEIAI